MKDYFKSNPYLNYSRRVKAKRGFCGCYLLTIANPNLNFSLSVTRK